MTLLRCYLIVRFRLIDDSKQILYNTNLHASVNAVGATSSEGFLLFLNGGDTCSFSV